MDKKDKVELSEGDEDEEEDENGAAPKKVRKQVECIMGDLTEEELRNMHPQRTTFEFKMGQKNSQVVITSDFDAGNMARCEQMESGNHVSMIQYFPNTFNLSVQYLDVF